MGATFDQFVPFQSSVFAKKGGPFPPKANAEVLLAPAPERTFLAVFKSFTSVQLVPLKDSVLATTGGVSPPKAKADVVVPH